jgi:hypothetical protein
MIIRPPTPAKQEQPSNDTSLLAKSSLALAQLILGIIKMEPAASTVQLPSPTELPSPIANLASQQLDFMQAQWSVFIVLEFQTLVGQQLPMDVHVIQTIIGIWSRINANVTFMSHIRLDQTVSFVLQTQIQMV